MELHCPFSIRATALIVFAGTSSAQFGPLPPDQRPLIVTSLTAPSSSYSSLASSLGPDPPDPRSWLLDLAYPVPVTWSEWEVSRPSTTSMTLGTVAREDGALVLWFLSLGSIGWHHQVMILGNDISRLASLVCGRRGGG